MPEAVSHISPHKNKVHKSLAYSYSWYTLFFLAGIFLDILFPLEIFDNSKMVSIGFTLIVLASLLILWAEKSSRKLDKENLSKETFCNGPYKYTRHPTHLGLFFLLLGFGVMINAIYLVIFTILYGILDRVVFIKKQDEILEAKYGEPFREYKRSVKF